MNFADTLADLNEWYFFREFVYSQNTFRPVPQVELELADSVIWLGDVVFAFQLKEREATAETSEEVERKWFEKKVLDQATKQIRDTRRYLKENSSISLKNHRGHERFLEFKKISVLHQLVVYLPSQHLPQDCLKAKYHISRTAGLIHVMPAHDYLGIVRTLLTPAEVAEYFSFRKALIERWKDEVLSVPEPALVGQFLQGDASTPPSLDYLDHLRTLDQRADEWDMSGIIYKFPDRITTNQQSADDYYPIVAEMASLERVIDL